MNRNDRHFHLHNDLKTKSFKSVQAVVAQRYCSDFITMTVSLWVAYLFFLVYFMKWNYSCLSLSLLFFYLMLKLPKQLQLSSNLL
jgi:hypothetical protein